MDSQLGKENEMRESTHMLFGIVNVLVVVIFIIGFSILSGALFHDEKAIDAGMSVGGIVGLGLAIGVIIAIKKTRDGLTRRESNKQ
jgi:hypothetical protein